MKTEIQQRLEQLAFARSQAFCYQDFIVCPTDVCPKCGTDDLMRYVPQVGNEYGIDWVVEYILKEELAPADLEESFEQMVRECYPEETIVGWMTFDTVTLKEQDPISWRCALSDYESEKESEGDIVSFNNGTTYYFTQDIEDLLTQEGH